MDQQRGQQQPGNGLIELTRFWERTSAKGNVYLSGFLQGARLLVFENKEHDPSDPRSPKWVAFIGPKTDTTNQHASKERAS